MCSAAAQSLILNFSFPFCECKAGLVHALLCDMLSDMNFFSLLILHFSEHTLGVKIEGKFLNPGDKNV